MYKAFHGFDIMRLHETPKRIIYCFRKYRSSQKKFVRMLNVKIYAIRSLRIHSGTVFIFRRNVLINFSFNNVHNLINQTKIQNNRVLLIYIKSTSIHNTQVYYKLMFKLSHSVFLRSYGGTFYFMCTAKYDNLFFFILMVQSAFLISLTIVIHFEHKKKIPLVSL